MIATLFAVVPVVVPVTASAQTPVNDDPFVVRNAAVRVVDDVYLLDATARIQLPTRVRNALDSGVDLHIAYEIEVNRRRDWWFDSTVAAVVQRYRLEFHELSLQYLVTNLNTGERRSYPYLGSALNHMSRLRGFPLMDRVLIDDPAYHYLTVRMRLQREFLPLPLRTATMFSGEWQLQSEWVEWSFE